MLRTTAVRRVLTLVCASLLFTACTKPPTLLDQARHDYLHQHYTLAFEKTLRLAKLCNPAAQYALGNMYFYGTGTVKDQDLARYWIERAASKGYCPAVQALHIIAQERYDQYAPIEPMTGKSLYADDRIPQQQLRQQIRRPEQHAAASQTPTAISHPPKLIAAKSTQMSGAISPKEARQAFARQRSISPSGSEPRRVLHNGKYVSQAMAQMPVGAVVDVRPSQRVRQPVEATANAAAEQRIPVPKVMAAQASSTEDTMWSHWQHHAQHHMSHAIHQENTSPKPSLAHQAVQHVAHADQAGHHHDGGFHWPWQHRQHSNPSPVSTSPERINTPRVKHTVAHKQPVTPAVKKTALTRTKPSHVTKLEHHNAPRKATPIAANQPSGPPANSAHKSEQGWFHLPHIHFGFGHNEPANPAANASVAASGARRPQTAMIHPQESGRQVHHHTWDSWKKRGTAPSNASTKKASDRPVLSVAKKEASRQTSANEAVKPVRNTASPTKSDRQVVHHTLDSWGNRSSKPSVSAQINPQQARTMTPSQATTQSAQNVDTKVIHHQSFSNWQQRSGHVKATASSTSAQQNRAPALSRPMQEATLSHPHHVRQLQEAQHGWFYRLTHHQNQHNSGAVPSQATTSPQHPVTRQPQTMPQAFMEAPSEQQPVQPLAENERMTIKPLAVHSGPSIILRKPGVPSHRPILKSTPSNPGLQTKVLTRSFDTHQQMRSNSRAATPATPLAHNKGENFAWATKQNPNDYTVQLTITSKPQKIKRFAELSIPGHNVVPYQFHTHKKVKYGAVCGSFKNAAEAEQFQASLPKQFSKYAHVFQWKELRGNMQPYS